MYLWGGGGVLGGLDLQNYAHLVYIAVVSIQF